MLLTIKELQMLDLLLKKSGNIINRNNSNDRGNFYVTNYKRTSNARFIIKKEW
nr:MAG TPA: hypothetical protein [Caudoviricetes sp.]